jgi:hypothetical protein
MSKPPPFYITKILKTMKKAADRLIENNRILLILDQDYSIIGYHITGALVNIDITYVSSPRVTEHFYRLLEYQKIENKAPS